MEHVDIWYFQGQKYKFYNDSGEFTLVINKVGLDDAAKYTCQAEEKRTSAYLEVMGEILLGLSLAARRQDVSQRFLEIYFLSRQRV